MSRKRLVLIAGAVVALVGLVLLGGPGSKGSNGEAIDDATLTAQAITEARAAGLTGEPRAQTAVRMSLAEWNALIDAELGKDAAAFGLVPDIPVFVLGIRGDVEWRAVGLPKPGQDSPERYDNITIVLDARTGNLLWQGSYYPGYPLPVSVPSPRP
jgi:hypothetical protein